jgi:hypothetical protein
MQQALSGVLAEPGFFVYNYTVRNLARVILFFTVSFLLCFVLAAAFRWFFFYLDAVRVIPALKFAPLSSLARALKTAIPAALYLCLMLSLSYAARNGAGPLSAIPVLFLLSLTSCLALSLGRFRLAIPALNAAAGGQERESAPPTLGQRGLRLLEGEVSIIVLGEPSDPASPRIVAAPGEALYYLSVPGGIRNTPPRLPPVPFLRNVFPLAGSIFADLDRAAEAIDVRQQAGFSTLLVYLASLCLMCVSFYPVFSASLWPLVNFFLGMILFRGILAFQVFIESDQIQNFIFFFAGRFIPKSVISPAVFGIAGTLALLYTTLLFAGKGRKRERHA